MERPAVPWLFGSTIGFSVVVGIVAVVAQIVFMIIWAVAVALKGGSIDASDFTTNGNLILGAVAFSYPIIFGLTFLIVRLRHGLTVSAYLGWHDWRAVTGKALLPWFGGLFGLMIVFETVTHLRELTGSKMMGELFETTNPYFLLVLLAFGAPLIEELFFRGFMFKGIEASRLGGIGAIVVTTLSWVVIHGFQYNLLELSYLLLIGLLFGCARAKTGSICLPLALHVVNNMVVVVPLLLKG